MANSKNETANSKNEIFAQRLKELRNDKNLTQQDLADAGGTTKTTISAYEAGNTTPNCEILSKIAKAYNVSMDWLCGLVEFEKGIDVENYAQLFDILIKITKSTLTNITFSIEEWENDGYGNNYPAGYYITHFQKQDKYNFISLAFEDGVIKKFVSEWFDIKELYDKGTIDENLYNLWLKQQFDKYKDVNIPKLSDMTADNNTKEATIVDLDEELPF